MFQCIFEKNVFNLLGTVIFFSFNWPAGCGRHAESQPWAWLLLKASDCQGCLLFL